MRSWIFLGLLLIAACDIDDSNNNNNDQTPDDQMAQVEGNVYSITYYFDKDEDETLDFSAYKFSFLENGVMKAIKDSVETTGTWGIQKSSDHNEFVINLGFAEPLEELNDDWHIVSLSEQIINLKDESGSGGTEMLTFTKQ